MKLTILATVRKKVDPADQAKLIWATMGVPRVSSVAEIKVPGQRKFFQMKQEAANPPAL